MDTSVTSHKSKLRRLKAYGSYGLGVVEEILHDLLICHVGFVVDGEPIVIPTMFALIDHHLYLHGSRISRLMNQAGSSELCISVAEVDGVVLARSLFEHTLNYRSVVLFGRGTAVTDAAEKREALERFGDKILPGRSTEVRRTSAKELRATTIVKVSLNQATAKVRSGPPSDGRSSDAKGDVWAGEIPIVRGYGVPRVAPECDGDLEIPPSVKALLGTLGLEEEVTKVVRENCEPEG